jgi:uncharacterized membrane protein YhaH (DUF805 family)
MIEWMILPFRRYAEFSGRSRRKEFWSFALLNVLVSMVLVALLLAGGLPLATMENPAMAASEGFGTSFWVILGLIMLWTLAVFIPNLALTVRRLHDREMSGWFFLLYVVLNMIPFVNLIAAIAFLVIMCLEGTRGPNKYGPDPKDPTRAEVFA